MGCTNENRQVIRYESDKPCKADVYFTLGTFVITVPMISPWNTTALIVIATCAVLSGCIGDLRWSEDVVLADGQTITISREVLYESGGGEWASNRSGTKPKSETIGIPFVTNRGVEWTTTKISPGTWPEIPLVIEIEGNRPVVYTLSAVSLACETYSKYVFRDDRWVEEPLPNNFPIRLTNLLFGNRANLPAHVTVEEKKKRNGGVYRRALKQVGPSKFVCG